ncbi:ribonuclease domain-containing protein [Streptomyces sp. NPDC014344]|uniref:ribonuclease domain-containing protein n=1 Tax=Streptomyces sp. NPDC014344 TaxID=3364871 RepID=UPI0036FA654A
MGRGTVHRAGVRPARRDPAHPGTHRRGRPLPVRAGRRPALRLRGGLPPRHDRGPSHECTVPAPGSDDRDARRVVTGGNDGTSCTDVHHATFTAVRDAPRPHRPARRPPRPRRSDRQGGPDGPPRPRARPARPVRARRGRPRGLPRRPPRPAPPGPEPRPSAGCCPPSAAGGPTRTPPRERATVQEVFAEAVERAPSLTVALALGGSAEHLPGRAGRSDRDRRHGHRGRMKYVLFPLADLSGGRL